MKWLPYLTLFVLTASGLLSCSPSEVPSATPTITVTLPTAISTQVYTPLTSVEELVGTYQNADRFYFRFYPDGTYHQAHTVEDLESQPYAISKFWFEGTEMNVEDISVSGVPSCQPNIGVYEVRLLETGNIKIVRITDKCTPRVRETELEFEPVP